MEHVSHYVLWGVDNDCYWIPDIKDSRYCCPICASKLSRSVENPDFYLKKKNYDLSATYDGFLIGSDKFLSVLKMIPNIAVECVQIKSDKRYKTKYFRLEFKGLVEIDLAKAVPEFGSICDFCGQFEHVVGAQDYYLRSMPHGPGIFRTDIEFGSGFEKSPVIAVDIDSAAIIKRAGLKGVTLDPVIIRS